jgi:hypothetical protein
MSKATAGKRLYSTASSVEVIVVKGADVSLACASAPMADAKQDAPASSAQGEAIQLSKRYSDEQTGLLVLCTKAGVGPLTVDGRELRVQATQSLPSSD